MKEIIAILVFTCSFFTNRAISQITKPVTANAVKKTTITNTIKQPVASTGAIPDLVTTITAIEKSGNNYSVKFTVKNQGGGSVDLSKVVMQGNVYTSTGSFISAGCGTTLINAGTLSAGQEAQSVLLCTMGIPLYNNETYIYKLSTDNTNAIPESNKANNTSESVFTGHAVPAAAVNATMKKTSANAKAKLPDLVIEINNITTSPSGPLLFTVAYTIKNIGNASINLKEYSVQGWVREESQTSYAAAGGQSLMYEGVVLEPGKTYTGTRGISAALIEKKGYKYKMEVTLSGSTNNPEMTTANNSSERFFSTEK